MKFDQKKISEFFSNIKPMDYAYPVTLFVYFIIVIILFSSATKFISENLNKKVISSTGKGAEHALNIDNYALAAKKLNIPVTLPKNDTEEEAVGTEPVATSTVPTNNLATTTLTTSTSTATSTLEQAEEDALATPDTSEITVVVLNSTPKTGLATTLAKAIEDAGFNAPKTGNQKIKLSTTTITIKESKRIYLPLVEVAVRTLYPLAIATTTVALKDTDPDISVVIGEH